ncbi:hypothetical protein [Microvirga sp. VF16]|uniref:hypothetical protein n=1 Tax=Microvirga sp. VF16 TaxID=2807101 RepID=UPI00193E20A6|nr:hypothetical protein [Microvirga sp. VF16]QRM32532.1 hypothetical protein JO965_31075 [Microvirga sp. VF16]
MPNRHRAEQGLDDPPPMIVKRARGTTSAIQGGALLDLVLDHLALKLLQPIFRPKSRRPRSSGAGADRS